MPREPAPAQQGTPGAECGGRLREGRVVENSCKKRGGPIDNRLVFVYI